MPFKNKIAVITGASRGLGYATALELGKQGAQVVALARTVGGLEELDDAIQKQGGLPAVLVPVDLVSGHEQLDRLGASLHERFGHINIFIHAAAMMGTLGPLAHGEPNEFQRVMNVNAVSAYRLLRSFDPLFRAAPRADVVTVDCHLGDDNIAYWGTYRTSKAMLRTITETYAREAVNTSISVISYMPPIMGTKLYGAAFPGADISSLSNPNTAAQALVNRLAAG